MTGCTKTIKISARNAGIIGSRKCGCTIHSEGLCKKHYSQRKAKLTNWEDRPDYREATPDDLIRQRSMKLKGTHIHRLFKVVQGVVKEYSSKENVWNPSQIAADPKLFVVLNF
jgi:hypothetical protein